MQILQKASGRKYHTETQKCAKPNHVSVLTINATVGYFFRWIFGDEIRFIVCGEKVASPIGIVEETGLAGERNRTIVVTFVYAGNIDVVPN